MTEQTVTYEEMNQKLRAWFKVDDSDLEAFEQGIDTKKLPLWRKIVPYIVLLMVMASCMIVPTIGLMQDGMTFGEVLAQPEIATNLTVLVIMSAIALAVYGVRRLIAKLSGKDWNEGAPPFDPEKEVHIFDGVLNNITIENKGVSGILKIGAYNFTLNQPPQAGYLFQNQTYRVYYRKQGKYGGILAMQLLKT